MKYLSGRENFLFDRINESMFYMSPDVREVLQSLSKNGNEISKELLDAELTDVKPDITFIDLADKEGFITFTQIKKADKLVNTTFQNNDGTPSIDIISGEFIDNLKEKLPDGTIGEKPVRKKLSKKWSDWVHKLDKEDSETATGVYTRGRNQVKIGKIVNKIFPGKFNDKEVEEFVNLFKAKTSPDEGEKFELVSGDDIAYWYDCKNYHSEDGTLGNSCMSSKNDNIFEIYTENPDVCRMLILKDTTSDKLIGRALVWKLGWTNWGREEGEPEYFMDRVYTIKDSDINKFHDFAEKQGWARKEYNNFDSHQNVHYKGKDIFLAMRVDIKSVDYNYYPYMDTFSEYDRAGSLYNNEDLEYSDSYQLRSTDGSYEVAGVWSEYYEESIPEDEAVYSQHLGSYIWYDRSVYVERGSYQGHYPNTYDQVYYDDFEEEYIHVDDAVYSEHHDQLIYDHVTVITKIDEDDGQVDEEDYFHSGGYLFMEFDELSEYIWYEAMEYEWDWSDDYRGISSELLMDDYKGHPILKIHETTTYLCEGDEWLTYEDALLLGVKILEEGDDFKENRTEDKYSYFERVWVDEGSRNVYQAIEDGLKEKERIKRIIDGEDPQLDLDDKEDYIEKLKVKFEKLDDYIEDLHNEAENMFGFFQFSDELAKDKIISKYGKIPSLEEIEKLEFEIKKDFIKEWTSESKTNYVTPFEKAYKFYENDPRFEGLTRQQVVDSTILNYIYVFPAFESKKIARTKEEASKYLEEKLGRKVDWKTEGVPGYVILKYHYDENDKRYTTANIDNALERQGDYQYLKQIKDYLNRKEAAKKFVKVGENLNKYSMKLKKFEAFTETPPSIEVKDWMSRKWISNKKFKKMHIKNLGDILHSVYSPIGHWKKKNAKGFFGVMDLPWDDERWSILNRINTNYTALSILVNEINEVLERGNSDIPKFDLVSPVFGSNEWYEEYNRLADFMKRNGKNIFLKKTEETGSTVINKIVDAIRRTRSVGDQAEKVVVEYLPKLNSNVTNIKLPEGSGDATDMVGGADVLFDYNGKTFTIQVKKVSYVNKRGSVYVTKGASISKHYKTDYYAILDRQYLYFFKNDPSKIQLIFGELSMEEDLLIDSFKYK